VPGSYMVRFHVGHTIAWHFVFVDREFGPTDFRGYGYGSTLNDELLEAVRQDPVVEFLENNLSGEANLGNKLEHTPVTHCFA
jgi:hypothetical protein